jgi:hypothetical protein
MSDRGEIVNETLRVVYSREQLAGREPVLTRTPLDEVMAREEGEPIDAYAMRIEAMRDLMSYFFAEGPHPEAVLKRVFAVAKAIFPQLVFNMSCEEIGLLFGETKAAVSYRIKLLVNRPIAALFGHKVQLPWQKSSSACAIYAARAKGNQNRRNHKPKKRPVTP